MGTIRVSYAPVQNAGDLLNKDLIERLSGKSVVCSKTYNADVIAIGGALVGIQYSGGVKRQMMLRALSLVYGSKPLHVWGSGFYRNDNNKGLYRNNLDVCALRGDLTRRKLSGLTGKTYDVPLADAGLLVDILLDSPVEKKYEIGLIPHFSQQQDAHFVKAQDDPKYHFIDIRRSPKEVAQEIASCTYIASSSLHGLIFADSMHIPSLRLLGKTVLEAGEFKFDDYYSCYGVKDNPWRNQTCLPSVNDIIDRACVDFQQVDEKKKALVKCFPKL